jgi:hypothetical protein
VAKPLEVIRAFLDSLAPEGAPEAAANSYRDAVAALTELEQLDAEASVYRVCIECSRSFVLDAADVAWYRKKVDKDGQPYKLPGRCSTCLDRRRTRARSIAANRA